MRFVRTGMLIFHTPGSTTHRTEELWDEVGITYRLLDTAGIELVEELITEHVNKGGLALSAAHQRLLDHAHFLRRLELS